MQRYSGGAPQSHLRLRLIIDLSSRLTPPSSTTTTTPSFAEKCKAVSHGWDLYTFATSQLTQLPSAEQLFRSLQPPQASVRTLMQMRGNAFKLLQFFPVKSSQTQITDTFREMSPTSCNAEQPGRSREVVDPRLSFPPLCITWKVTLQTHKRCRVVY